MKKLVIGIGTVISIAFWVACDGLKADQSASTGAVKRSAAFSNTVEKSLNGIAQADASTMVKDAASNIDPNPPNTQIWFSKQTVQRVYDLLKEDSAGVNKPDGIRIYFTNSGIVVVSTRDSTGTDTVKLHRDYFTHSNDADLFKSDSIGGIVSHDSDTSNGAMLYGICNCDITKRCLTQSTHDIKRSVAETMVQSFKGSPFNVKSEWFDIKMLENLLTEMHDEQDDGIRIYFARGVTNIGRPVDIGKARFVVTTTRSVPNTNIHKDFFDCSHPPLATTIKDRIKPGGPSQDNGELCPSNCDGVTLPLP